MTFYEYLVLVNVRLHKDRDQRIGQLYTNELSVVRSDIYEKMMDAEPGSNIDPFYNSKNLDRFLEFVHTNWEK